MNSVAGSFLMVVLLAGVVACSGAPHDRAVNAALRSVGEPIKYCPPLRADALTKQPLPAQIAVHKVVPRQFPQELMDRLFQLTGIDPNQTFQGANRGVFGTPGVRYYGSLRNNHTLAVIPAQGWMHYERLEAIDDKGDRTLTGPTEEQALRWGVEFATFLGLKKDELARHPTKDRLDYLFTKIEGGPVLQEPRVKARGVMLRRAIDGFPVTTGRLVGGFSVEYGFNGMIYKFELAARATEPTSTIQVAPMAEQLKVLADGKQVYGVRWPVDPKELRKDKDAALELEFVELVYFEDTPEKFQKIIPPLLRWEGELKFMGQSHTVILYTPIKESGAERN